MILRCSKSTAKWTSSKALYLPQRPNAAYVQAGWSRYFQPNSEKKNEEFGFEKLSIFRSVNVHNLTASLFFWEERNSISWESYIAKWYLEFRAISYSRMRILYVNNFKEVACQISTHRNNVCNDCIITREDVLFQHILSRVCVSLC